ncbi:MULTISPECIES: SH3 domain-containing protein [Roseobacteraceae]|uniref:SH3 domain-containing protein n=1 Tax=Roseobacteraceae TaxID=2854170 RepID=UPI0031D70609
MPRPDPNDFIRLLSRELPACEVLERMHVPTSLWANFALEAAASTLPLSVFAGDVSDATAWVPPDLGLVSAKESRRLWEAILNALPLEPLEDRDSGAAGASESSGRSGGYQGGSGGAIALPTQRVSPLTALLNKAAAKARQQARRVMDRFARDGGNPRRQFQLRAQLHEDIIRVKADLAAQVVMSEQIVENLREIERLVNNGSMGFEQARVEIEALVRLIKHPNRKAPKGIAKRTWEALSRLSVLITLLSAPNNCEVATVMAPQINVVVEVQAPPPAAERPVVEGEWVWSSINTDKTSLTLRVGPSKDHDEIAQIPKGHPVERKEGTQKNGFMLIRYVDANGIVRSGYVAEAYLLRLY